MNSSASAVSGKQERLRVTSQQRSADISACTHATSNWMDANTGVRGKHKIHKVFTHAALT